MSTMKSFLTTLDLVMQDKVEPETVVEEDEIEETLTINEDGEIVDENWLTDKLKAAGTAVKGSFDRAKEKSQDDPTHWSNANMSKDDKSHMKTSRKIHKQFRKDIDNDNSEEDESTLMGGKYDESVEQIEKFVLECEQLNDIKRLSGLKEAKPGSMSTAFGKNQWRVEEEDDGWQVYIWSEPNNDWIAQGQPHKTQAEAEKDAKSFFD